MFVSQHVPLLMQKATLRLEKNREQEYVRLADLSLVLEPFPFELAAELDESIASHLFTPERTIRAELESIKLDPRVEKQMVTVQEDPSLPVLATLRQVEVVELSVAKKVDEKAGRIWLKATIVVTIDLSERAVREFLFHHFGMWRMFSFQAEQGELELSPAQRFVHESQRMMKPDGLTSIEMTTTDPETGRRTGTRITKDKVENIN